MKKFDNYINNYPNKLYLDNRLTKMDNVCKIALTKSIAIVGMWSFAYLGKHSENQLLIEIAKAKQPLPANFEYGCYYGYACLGTILII